MVSNIDNWPALSNIQKSQRVSDKLMSKNFRIVGLTSEKRCETLKDALKLHLLPFLEPSDLKLKW